MNSIKPTIINENTIRVQQPLHIKTKLKAHQLAMIREMMNLEKPGMKKVEVENSRSSKFTYDTKFGCICDKVGSGKSLTILGLISTNNFLSPGKNITYNKSKVVSICEERTDVIPINILVVPHGIMNQWITYLDNDTTLNYRLVKNKKTLETCQEDINKYMENPEENYESIDCHLYLVSSTFYSKFVSCSLYNKNISRLFVDEVDVINIKSVQPIDAEFTWFISASKSILEKPLGEIRYEPHIYTGWDGNTYNINRRVILNKIPHTGYFRDILMDLSESPIINKIYLKSDDEFVESSFSLPELTNIIVKCKNTQNHTILNGIIDQDTMSMINAGDIKGAMDSMGCKIQNEDTLIGFVTKKLEIQLRDKKTEFTYKSQISYSSAQVKQQSLDNIQKQIDEINQKIDCIKKRILENNHCAICTDDITNKVIVSCCNNPFCFECISISLTHKLVCPMCRASIGTNNIIALDNDIKDEEDEILEENEKQDYDREKIENFKLYFDKLIEQPNKKLLIFSKYEASFGDIKKYIESKNIKFSELKGVAGRITNIVNKYKSFDEDRIDVLLLNAQYFGSGLNLENTSDIFLYHNMGVPLTTQVIGRAQRPGRTEPLTVTRFYYTNEL